MRGGGIETLVHVTGGGRLHSCTLVPSSIVTDTHRALQSLHFYLLFEIKEEEEKTYLLELRNQRHSSQKAKRIISLPCPPLHYFLFFFSIEHHRQPPHPLNFGERFTAPYVAY